MRKVLLLFCHSWTIFQPKYSCFYEISRAEDALTIVVVVVVVVTAQRGEWEPASGAQSIEGGILAIQGQRKQEVFFFWF